MKKLTAPDFLSATGKVMLDVRTPAEFAQGHVPGAFNLPLFSNEERAEIGTLYKKINPERAMLRGLDFAGLKLSWYVREAMRLAPQRRVALHCWRGGMRSGSLATLLHFSGFEVTVLEGGYKAYRQWIHEAFGQSRYRFVVIGGKTGSGKTEILRALEARGEQVLDLEKLAHHKGSAFGALGEEPQPTVEQFENDLFQAYDRLSPTRRVWLENESRSIGRIFLPHPFWQQMKAGVLIHVEVPDEERISRLVREYGSFPKQDLENALLQISKRMGGQHVKAAQQSLAQGDLETATALALRYYDKSYLHATEKGNFYKIHPLLMERLDASSAAVQLIELANQHGY